MKTQTQQNQTPKKNKNLSIPIRLIGGISLFIFLSFSLKAQNWVQYGNTMSGTPNFSSFGSQVAITPDGSRVIVGSPFSDEAAEQAGKVEVFEYNANNQMWEQIGNDLFGNANSDKDNFGHSVQISDNGNIIAVGAAQRNTGTFQGGAATNGYIKAFEYNAGTDTWDQLGSTIVGDLTDGALGHDISLSADGHTILSSQPEGSPPNGGFLGGRVQVFDYDAANGWQQRGNNIDGANFFDLYGDGVAITPDGNRIAFGGNDGDGANETVRIYDYNSGNSTWDLVTSFVDPDNDNSEFGTALAFSSDGSTLIVGARRAPNGDNSVREGAVYVYQDNNGWAQLGNTLTGTIGNFEFYGKDVAISSDGTRIGVGASRAGNGSEGRIRIYDLNTNNNMWEQVGQDFLGGADFNQMSDVDLTADGNKVVTGNLFGDETSTDAGDVKVYELNTCNDPDVPTLSASANNFCPGGMTTISIGANDQLNDATKWVLYSGSCGGTMVDENNTGSFDITVNSTTDYFVRGEGDCVTGGSCGNIKITIQDTENPVAVCPNTAPIVTLDANGNGMLAANALAGGNSTDNCGTVTETSPMATFNCSDLGTKMVTLTATDGSSNTDTKSCSVTVQDNINPVAVCPTNAPVVTLDVNGNGTLAADALAGGNSTDNCGTVTETSPMATYTCNDIGTQMVNLTATDGSSKTDTKSCSVTVQDNMNPVAVCPTNTPVVSLDVNGNGTLATNALAGGNSTDNCVTVTETSPMTSFTCSDVGTQMVTLTATDGSSNTDTKGCSVTVQDNMDPVAKCKVSISIDLDGSGFASIGLNDIDDGSSDGCGIDDYSFDRSTNFNCTDLANSPVSIKLIVTDEAGNSNDCTTSVTINDPNMACCANPDVPTLSASANNFCAGSMTTISIGANDQLNDATKWVLYSGSCGGTIVDENTTGSFDVTVNTTTDYFVRGEGGCISGGNCGMIKITIQDTQNPVAVCPNTAPVVTLDANGNGTLAANALAGGNSTDNCGTVTEMSPMTTFNCNDLGTQMVTLTATDGSSNTDTKSCSVTVQDNINPVAVCPNNAPVVTLDANGNGTLVANALAGGNSTDNCGTVTETSPMTTFNCNDLGTQMVTLTATDGSSNTDTKSCSVTVQDNINPVAVCPNNAPVVTLDANGNGTLVANALVGGNSTDNCGTVTETNPMTTFSCSDLGTQMVILTATDGSSNTDTKSCSVTVQDNINPVAVCPTNAPVVTLDANGNGMLSVNALAGGNSTDNCGTVTETSPMATYTCSNLGTQMVILTATDGSSNTNTKSCSVTVQDNINPVAVCPTNALVVTLDANGNGTLSANALAGGNSTDNCGTVTETSPMTSFDCSHVGTQMVTLTATDGSSNTDTKGCSVTVQDNIDPVAICPTTNPTLTIDASGNAVLAANALAGNSTDNCSIATETSPMMSYTCSQLGNHTVTLTATDPSGNTHTTNCTITVEDTAPPTVTCKDITIELNNSGTLTIVATDVYESTADNCAIATMTVSPNTFDCSNKGVNVVVLTVNDYAGNSDDCNANVTVEDTTNPVANCKPATIQLNANGLATLTSSQLDNNSMDDCGIASYALSQSSFDCSNTGNNQVTLTVTDNSGLSSSCTATVTVEDALKPTAKCKDFTIACPGSQVTITPADVNDGSFDNCSVSLSLDQTVLSCSNSSVMVTLTATDPSGNTDDCTAVVTLQSSGGGGITLSIDDVEKQEGNFWGVTIFKFTVTRSGGTGAVTVDFATQDGTATSTGPLFSRDYTNLYGTLTWSSGGTNTKFVNVAVKKDNNAEPDENFFVNLSNPTGGAVIGDGQGEGIILNDDGAPIIIDPNEGNQSIQQQHFVEAGLELNVYPNPVRTVMNIELSAHPISDNPTNSQLKIVDLNGRTIWTHRVQNQENFIQVPTGDWSRGAYILYWINDQEVKMQKVIIE